METKKIMGHIMAVTGGSIDDLARKHGFSKNAIYDVFRGRTKSQRIRKIINDIVAQPVSSKKPEDIWDN